MLGWFTWEKMDYMECFYMENKNLCGDGFGFMEKIKIRVASCSMEIDCLEN